MNSIQMDALTERALRGAMHIRDRNEKALECQAELQGWWMCAFYGGDKETARTAQRALYWIRCAIWHELGEPFVITEAAHTLMWGDAS